MISVTEAKNIIKANTLPLTPVKTFLRDASGKILAEDVYATTDIPMFPQSSMDGYAFMFSDWEKNQLLAVEGVIAAGNADSLTLSPGGAVRIFTGAAVPRGADTVVMQEKVRIENDNLVIEEGILQGANVRPAGSEIIAGKLALKKDTLLSPAAVGFLSGIGIAETKVYPDPVISIIVTGKELQQPGSPLQYGKVYESNSPALSAALHQLHFKSIKIFWADDDPGIITHILEDALKQSDLVLLTGGVSVGDYDFVLDAAANCGVKTLFHKIKQRPGKPLYFGSKENKPVFGLPGNPSSVLVCFYEYVLPCLEILTRRKISLKQKFVPLSKPFRKTNALTHFLKGHYNGEMVTTLEAQESYRLSSFAQANCLVKINEETEECKKGEMVEIHLLPD